MSKIDLLFISILFVAALFMQSLAQAKTVYAIPSHSEHILHAYSILNDPAGQLEFKDEYDIILPFPVDVAVDTESNILFITAEGYEEVELVNARTFRKIKRITAPSASDLAGIVVDYIDPNTTRLYTVDRGTAKLFDYDWDAANKELTLLPPNGYFDPNDPDDPNFPAFHTLLSEDPNDPYDPDDLGPITAHGLALDDDGILYVSQYSRIVHAFDTTDDFRHVRTIDLGQHDGQDNIAMDIDIDTTNNYLYTGGYRAHNYLVKTWLRIIKGVRPQWHCHA